MLAINSLTGYISSVKNLLKSPENWECGGVPLTMMMNIERRKGKEKPVIQKALVDLNDKPFKAFEKMRQVWANTESYLFPGPIQYFGPKQVTDLTTKTMVYELNKK